ncbi:hypothetical protein AXF42_Ash007417 [Apostasia shenzhenica]|uniref:Uncharacterized protein n=1 Tax=Apostasia shenzhenica TaxID=1088818 RepID=A0A2I0BA55_9ASPA|nr:hypothetical protein AXF42_Ash007417 [Apostasia shenzhenica]
MFLSSGFTIPANTPIQKIGRRICVSVAHASSSNSSPRIHTEQLRSQIDQLHAEAEITRSKAQNLQQRAATNVAFGKENEARDLLKQKKKLIQALQRTKRRLEVLDELSLKINEAISLKETQLIGNVTLPEISREDSSLEIRIISPKVGVDEETQSTNIYDPQYSQPCGDQDSEALKTETSFPLGHEKLINQGVTHGIQIDENIINSRAISTYDEFLERIDEQLRQVESDLFNFMRLSTIILENKQEHMNSKVQQTLEILDNVRSIRGRIATFMKRRANEKGPPAS